MAKLLKQCRIHLTISRASVLLLVIIEAQIKTYWRLQRHLRQLLKVVFKLSRQQVSAQI